MTLSEVIENNEMLEIGRKAVEDALVELRDERISLLDRGNGLVILEKDGSFSNTIRLGAEDALRIALKAIIRKVEGEAVDGAL